LLLVLLLQCLLLGPSVLVNMVTMTMAIGASVGKAISGSIGKHFGVLVEVLPLLSLPVVAIVITLSMLPWILVLMGAIIHTARRSTPPSFGPVVLRPQLLSMVVVVVVVVVALLQPLLALLLGLWVKSPSLLLASCLLGRDS
jgi:hypothetical protein